MRSYISIALSAILLAGAACDKDDTTDPSVVSDFDKQFILAAADDALFQVNAGQVATSGATLKSIQNYAEQMTESHTEAGQELQKLAASRQVQIPTTLSDDRQEQLDSLAMYSEARLDTLYLNQMVTAQRRAVRTLELATSDGDDAELKKWANDRLPSVREYASRAVAMRDSVARLAPEKK